MQLQISSIRIGSSSTGALKAGLNDAAAQDVVQETVLR